MATLMKCSILFFFLPCMAFAGLDAEVAEKKIQRDFKIRSEGMLEIDNRHGNIDIAIGPVGSIKMEIFISVSSGSKSRSEEALDRIDVMFEEGNNRVSAVTEIESEGTGWKTWFSSGKLKLDIRYQVLVPADVFLELTNKFGNIYVETTNRDLDIELSYGELNLGDINADLTLEMNYSEGTLSQILDGTFELDYSDIEMENAEQVTLEMKYGNLKAGSIKKLTLESASSDLRFISVDKMDIDSKYGNIHVEQAGEMNTESSFTTITVDELTSDGNFNMRYGDLKIYKVQRSFSALNINTSYTGVQLKFAPGASYTLDAVTNYCDIVYTQLKVTESIAKNTNRVIKGTVGTGSARVNARMNYGELRLE